MIECIKGRGIGQRIFSLKVTVETGVKSASSYPVPPPFNQKDVPRLGFIDIDLVDLTIIRGDD
jgi:hypothetical protein